MLANSPEDAPRAHPGAAPDAGPATPQWVRAVRHDYPMDFAAQACWTGSRATSGALASSCWLAW